MKCLRENAPADFSLGFTLGGGRNFNDSALLTFPCELGGPGGKSISSTSSKLKSWRSITSWYMHKKNEIKSSFQNTFIRSSAILNESINELKNLVTSSFFWSRLKRLYIIQIEVIWVQKFKLDAQVILYLITSTLKRLWHNKQSEARSLNRWATASSFKSCKMFVPAIRIVILWQRYSSKNSSSNLRVTILSRYIIIASR